MNDYPLTSFHFRVNVEGASSEIAKQKLDKHKLDFKTDFAFQSVSGLDVQLETESVKEGGENRFEHTLPLRTKYSNLMLKRGLGMAEKSGLMSWCKLAFENAIYIPLNLTIKLLDQQHDPLVVWNVRHAWPTSWKMGELNADKGEVLIETLELKYNSFVFDNSKL